MTTIDPVIDTCMYKDKKTGRTVILKEVFARPGKLEHRGVRVGYFVYYPKKWRGLALDFSDDDSIKLARLDGCYRRTSEVVLELIEYKHLGYVCLNVVREKNCIKNLELAWKNISKVVEK